MDWQDNLSLAVVHRILDYLERVRTTRGEQTMNNLMTNKVSGLSRTCELSPETGFRQKVETGK